MSRRSTLGEKEVFVNCPFDDLYLPLFHAVIFTLHACRYVPRSALEVENVVEPRFEKIVRIIRQCRLGIHDISRTESNTEGMPRFNMPLELGLFLGAARYGGRSQKAKAALVLDHDPHRYQKFISDLSGQDIRAHGGKVGQIIREVRKWLASQERQRVLPGGDEIIRQYGRFQKRLPAMLKRASLKQHELQYRDLNAFIAYWFARRSSGGVKLKQ